MSRGLDLVAAEYGYTDAVTLRIPIRRLRQMVAAIMERKHYQSQKDWLFLKWQTRTICQAVAQTITDIPQGMENPVLRWANGIGEPQHDSDGDPEDDEEVSEETKEFFKSLEAPNQTTDNPGKKALDPIGLELLEHMESLDD